MEMIDQKYNYLEKDPYNLQVHINMTHWLIVKL